MNRRLESMNEFRDALKDQASGFLTKSEYNLIHDRVVDDIRILRESKASLEGKASQKSVNIAYIISAMSILLAVIALLHSFMS